MATTYYTYNHKFWYRDSSNTHVLTSYFFKSTTTKNKEYTCTLPKPTRTNFSLVNWYCIDETQYLNTTESTTMRAVRTQINAKHWQAIWQGNFYVTITNTASGSNVYIVSAKGYIPSGTFTFPVLSRTGYTQSVFYGDCLDTYAPNSTITIYDDEAYTASWNPNTYTITLNKSGGSGGSDTITEVYNSSITSSITIPSKTGFTITFNANGSSVSPTSKTSSYVFNGYYSASSGGTQYYNSSGAKTSSLGTTTFTSNATIYAQWGYGSITLPTPTVPTGHNFNGWYTASSGGTRIGGAGSSYTPTSSFTVYAQWSKQSYTVSFNMNGHGTQVSPITHTYGTASSLPTPTASGYVFSGWLLGSTNIGTTLGATAITDNTTLYANWGDGDKYIKIYYNGSWVNAIPYVYTTSWQKCKPYIFDGSNWRTT